MFYKFTEDNFDQGLRTQQKFCENSLKIGEHNRTFVETLIKTW